MDLLILDIDETLVHSCDEWIGRRHDFLAADNMIFEHSFVKEFIEEPMSIYNSRLTNIKIHINRSRDEMSNPRYMLG